MFAPAHEVEIRGDVVRPRSPDGDQFYGLEPGTNGSGAAMRRRVVAEGLHWVRHNGSAATGLLLVPSSRATWVNPWGPGR